MSNRPMPGEIYKHFKGNLYRIVTLAKHSESGEQLVIYQALYGDFQVYARPLAMFMETVDKNKYPDAVQEYRFEKQQELIQAAVQPVQTITQMDAGKGSKSVEQTTCRIGTARETKMLEQAMQQTEEVQQAAKQAAEAAEEEIIDIDPLVLEFLDAGTYEERLNILAALHHRITDQMITTMALAVDVEIEDGDVEERYEELKNCLLTYEKYECNRLR